MSGWGDGAAWQDERLRREVFLFRSGPDLLYGSLTAAIHPTTTLGLVVVPSWGQDMADQLELCHHLARQVAESGGAGLVYHPPGQGDSGGRMEDVTVEGLTAAAMDAVAAAAARVPEASWQLGGVGLGASVAVLAASARGSSVLPLVHPELDPEEYFARLERYARLARLGTEGGLFGYPLGEGLSRSARTADVSAALSAFPGRGAVVRFSSPPADPPPAPLEEVVVPGEWLQPLSRSDLPSLARAASRWTIDAAAGTERLASAERRA